VRRAEHDARPSGHPPVGVAEQSHQRGHEEGADDEFARSFAVDQQQWLQGYLPIEFLYLYKRHEGQTVGGGTTVASGPLLVDKSNISSVSAAITAADD
jgi:hypothetical protein